MTVKDPIRNACFSTAPLATAVLLAFACGADPVANADETGGGSTGAETPPASMPADATGSVDDGTTQGPMTDATTGGGDQTDGSSTDAGSTGEGSTDAGSTDGGSTDAGSTDEGATDDESTGGSTGEMMSDAPPWLVHLSQTGGDLRLYQIDIETAVVTEQCEILTSGSRQPMGEFAYSVTFTRDDRLLFSDGGSLWEVELPSCLATELGGFGFGEVWGIAPDDGFDLFGVDANTDSLIHIDAGTGAAVSVGPLGSDWFTLGATWNEDEQQLLGLSGNTDSIYDLDTVTGAATLIQGLGVDFVQVGFEYHPNTELSYACTDNAHLLRIEADGSVTDLGDMGFSDCLNLGAPWSDAVQLPAPA